MKTRHFRKANKPKAYHLPYQLTNNDNLKYAKERVDDSFSLIKKVTKDIHIGLLPSFLGKLKLGLETVLGNKLWTYDTQLDGILVAYENLALTNSGNGLLVPDSAHVHLSVRADFYLFTPEMGSVMIGRVEKKTTSTLVCITNDVFTAFVMADSSTLRRTQINSEVLFSISQLDLCSKIPLIEGTYQGSLSSADGDEAEPSGGRSLRFTYSETANGLELDSGVSLNGDHHDSSGGETGGKRKKKRKKTDSCESSAAESAPSPEKPVKKRRREETSESDTARSPEKRSKKRRVHEMSDCDSDGGAGGSDRRKRRRIKTESGGEMSVSDVDSLAETETGLETLRRRVKAECGAATELYLADPAAGVRVKREALTPPPQGHSDGLTTGSERKHKTHRNKTKRSL